jgi:hypothetical protein
LQKKMFSPYIIVPISGITKNFTQNVCEEFDGVSAKPTNKSLSLLSL